MRLTRTESKPLNQGLQSAAKIGLQSVLGWWITKCDSSRLQSVLSVGLQSVAKWITKCVRDYIRWQGGLQSAPGITKCGGIIKWVSTTYSTILKINKYIDIGCYGYDLTIIIPIFN